MASRNRGRKKTSLRSIGRAEPSFDEFSARLDSLSTGDQTAAAISGAVIVEHELERLLRDHFRRNDDETWDLLIEDVGPLRSFHTKIVISYAFGILDDASLFNINIIRQIRNAFAHSKKQLSFEDPLIFSTIRSAKTPDRTTKADALAFEFVRNSENAQQAYAVLCDAVGARLVRRSRDRLNRRSKRLRKQAEATRMSLVAKALVMRSLSEPRSRRGLAPTSIEYSLPRQSDDPKLEAHGASPPISLARSEEPPSNTGT